MFSSLCKSIILTKKYGSRNGNKISKVTIHHMAGFQTGEACAKMHINSKCSQSANYYIGVNGEIVGSVDEDNRAFTSGSAWNDQRAVTIEVANCAGEPDWKVSDKVMSSLIVLVADICRRNDISSLDFTGDKKGSLTYHYMFQATRCPGEFLKSKTSYICNKVNEALKGLTPEPTPVPTQEQKDNSFLVKITCSDLNIRKGPGQNYPVTGHIKDRGVYTIIETKDNWGKLKSGAGWICLYYAERRS